MSRRITGISFQFFALLALLSIFWGRALPLQAQQHRYTLALRGVPLAEAIEKFVDATGLAVAYDPTLVRDKLAYCAAENEEAEGVLRCILKQSGLDFYRLSSGTYVLTRAAEVRPQHGYLAGVVTDLETGNPLANAHVLLVDAGLGSVTNGAGQFIFPPLLAGPYAMRVTHLGYHPWEDTLRIDAQARTHTRASLIPEPILITPVVIDGLQRREGSEFLGQSRLGTRQVSTSFDPRSEYLNLSTLAGVRMHDVTSDIHVQGGDAGEHELRLDNVPVYLPRASIGLIGPFSAFALERITIHKAGFDVAGGSLTSGVILAEHLLKRSSGFDAQLDPLSFNGHLHLSPKVRGTSEVAVMMAARIGLWDIYEPDRVQQMLREWNGIDPNVHFSDFHGATRIRLGPLRSIYASAYRGASSLGGNSALGRSTLFDIPLSAPDNYAWHNTLGQVRYDAVVGSRTMIDAQIRASRYELRHDYIALDSLQFQTSTGTPNLTLFTVPTQDYNEVQTIAAETGIDFAFGRHHLSAGIEAIHTESAFNLYGVRFASDKVVVDQPEIERDYFADFTFASTRLQKVRHAPTTWKLAGFLSDRLTFRQRIYIEPGVRLTYFPDRATVYAEPRFALRLDRDEGWLGGWSSRTSAGLYRQFTMQVDVSTINPNTLLPSVRVWLPLDASVSPPMAYHFSQEFLFNPTRRWKLGVEAYYKYQPHQLAIRYAPYPDPGFPGQVRDQGQFMVDARGEAYGGALSLEWTSDRFRFHSLYERSRATRQSDRLFEGRETVAPWNEPHRLELGIDWSPLPGFIFSTRGRGIWGRSWGFRQAYYDYLGHAPTSRYQGAWDMGNPSEHVLPALLQVDVSLAYSNHIGPVGLQVRLDILNLTDRQNVADWSLTSRDGMLVKEARYLYPRIPSLAIRLGF